MALTDAQKKKVVTLGGLSKYHDTLMGDISDLFTGEETRTESTYYKKPSGGIPKSDLASAVQTSLGKADSALQSHQDISGKADKSATVSNVAYDSTNKKITKTINGSTTDVVSVATLKSAMNLGKSDVSLGNVTNDAQVKRTEMGAANGVATLDSNGKVPASQLPAFVDDIIEGYLSGTHFYKEAAHTTIVTDATGASADQLSNKVYLDLSNGKSYRWSGSAYSVIGSDLALGETSSTAYRGDRGKTAYDHSQATHARTDATKTEASSTNGNIKINGTETTVYTHPTTAGNKHVPSGGSSGQFLGYNAAGEAKWVNNPNTDTSVTAVGNHYAPAEDSNAQLSASASGATAAWSIDVVKGITIKRDAKGHVTGVSVTSGKIPANPNSDTKNTAGSTDTSSKIFLVGATSQAANPQTYSHDTAYVGTDGCLYSGSSKTLTEGDVASDSDIAALFS